MLVTAVGDDHEVEQRKESAVTFKTLGTSIVLSGI